MENLPLYIPLVFILTILLGLYFFYQASGRRRIVLVVSLLWLTGQGLAGISGFYTNTYTLPPRLALLLFPPLAGIAVLFLTKSGRRFIASLDLKVLSLLHLIRVPVELVLLWLSLHLVVPQIMTFEGRNFDILSGLTAPAIYYFGFVRKRLHRSVLIAWNVICLALLIHIVTIAILSAPTPFQHLAFDRPNIAVFYFPYVWLPGFLVPLVFFAHIVSLSRLWRPVASPMEKEPQKNFA